MSINLFDLSALVFLEMVVLADHPGYDGFTVTTFLSEDSFNDCLCGVW